MSNILKKFAAKLDKAAAKKIGNTPFTHAEIREHSEATPGRWSLFNTEPNRLARRAVISPRNMERYAIRIGDAIEKFKLRMQFIEMVNAQKNKEEEIKAAA